MNIETYLDELQRFADETYHAELIAARVEYFAGLGRINESDDSFEAHLDRFLDWFLFERALPQTGQTPLVTFTDQKRETLSDDDLRIFEGFIQNLHSLFQVRKTDAKGVHLTDLLIEKKFFVEDELPNMFSKGQIFEARILPFGGGWRFSKGYIFHPLTTVKFIEKRLKRIPTGDREAQKALIRDLAICRLKADRYKHIEALQFYKI